MLSVDFIEAELGRVERLSPVAKAGENNEMDWIEQLVEPLLAQLREAVIEAGKPQYKSSPHSTSNQRRSRTLAWSTFLLGPQFSGVLCETLRVLTCLNSAVAHAGPSTSVSPNSTARMLAAVNESAQWVLSLWREGFLSFSSSLTGSPLQGDEYSSRLELLQERRVHEVFSSLIPLFFSLTGRWLSLFESILSRHRAGGSRTNTTGQTQQEWQQFYDRVVEFGTAYVETLQGVSLLASEVQHRLLLSTTDNSVVRPVVGSSSNDGCKKSTAVDSLPPAAPVSAERGKQVTDPAFSLQAQNVALASLLVVAIPSPAALEGIANRLLRLQFDDGKTAVPVGGQLEGMKREGKILDPKLETSIVQWTHRCAELVGRELPQSSVVHLQAVARGSCSMVLVPGYLNNNWKSYTKYCKGETITHSIRLLEATWVKWHAQLSTAFRSGLQQKTANVQPQQQVLYYSHLLVYSTLKLFVEQAMLWIKASEARSLQLKADCLYLIRAVRQRRGVLYSSTCTDTCSSGHPITGSGNISLPCVDCLLRALQWSAAIRTGSSERVLPTLVPQMLSMFDENQQQPWHPQQLLSSLKEAAGAISLTDGEQEAAFRDQKRFDESIWNVSPLADNGNKHSTGATTASTGPSRCGALSSFVGTISGKTLRDIHEPDTAAVLSPSQLVDPTECVPLPQQTNFPLEFLPCILLLLPDEQQSDSEGQSLWCRCWCQLPSAEEKIPPPLAASRHSVGMILRYWLSARWQQWDTYPALTNESEKKLVGIANEVLCVMVEGIGECINLS